MNQKNKKAPAVPSQATQKAKEPEPSKKAKSRDSFEQIISAVNITHADTTGLVGEPCVDGLWCAPATSFASSRVAWVPQSEKTDALIRIQAPSDQFIGPLPMEKLIDEERYQECNRQVCIGPVEQRDKRWVPSPTRRGSMTFLASPTPKQVQYGLAQRMDKKIEAMMAMEAKDNSSDRTQMVAAEVAKVHDQIRRQDPVIKRLKMTSEAYKKPKAILKGKARMQGQLTPGVERAINSGTQGIMSELAHNAGVAEEWSKRPAVPASNKPGEGPAARYQTGLSSMDPAAARKLESQRKQVFGPGDSLRSMLDASSGPQEFCKKISAKMLDQDKRLHKRAKQHVLDTFADGGDIHAMQRAVHLKAQFRLNLENQSQ